MTRRATIRRDHTTSTWTAHRPAYGFSPHDEVRSGFATQLAALRGVNSTLHPLGTPALLAERSWRDEDDGDAELIHT